MFKLRVNAPEKVRLRNEQQSFCVSIVRGGCSFAIKRNNEVVDVFDDFRSLAKLTNSFELHGIPKAPATTKAALEAEIIDPL